MTRKKMVCITLDKELIEIIDQIADKNDLSRSYIINKILKDYLKDFIETKKKSEEKAEKIINDVLKTQGVM